MTRVTILRILAQNLTKDGIKQKQIQLFGGRRKGYFVI